MHASLRNLDPRAKWLAMGLVCLVLAGLAWAGARHGRARWQGYAMDRLAGPGAALFQHEARGLDTLYHPLPRTEALSFPAGPIPGAANYRIYAVAAFRLNRAARLTASALSDDGVRLFVDGRLLARDWSHHPPRLAQGRAGLSAGWHLLEVEYFQAAGGAVLRVELNADGKPLALSAPGPGFEPQRFKKLALYWHRLLRGFHLALGLLALWLLWPLLARAWRALAAWLERLAPLAPAGPEPNHPLAPWKAGNRLPLLLYLLAALAFTWPLVTELGQSIPSNLGWERERHSAQFSDSFIFLWNVWWHKTALSQGLNPFFCPLVFHPGGASLALHTHGFVFSAFALPFWALGPVASYSLGFLALLVATGYTAYVAGRRLVGGAGPAWLVGFIFAFNHWHLGRGLGQMNLFSALFLPLFFWALWRAGRPDARPGHWLLAGALLAANYYAGSYHFLFALGFAAVFLALGPWLAARPAWSLATWRGLGLMALSACILSAPLWGAVVWAQASGLAFYPEFTLPDLPWRMLFTRPILHPWFSKAAAVAVTGPDPQYQWSMYLGWPLAGLCLLGLLPMRRAGRPWFWLAAGLFFAALALNAFGLPRLAAGYLPVLKSFRGWAEFLCPLLLCAAFLAGRGLAFLQALFRRLAGPAGAGAALGLVLALLALDFLPLPYPTARLTIPAAYQKIAADPRPVAVMELPDRAGHNVGPSRFMLYQTVDGKPRFGSHISRTPIPAVENLHRHKQLMRLFEGKTPAPGELARELALLKVGWVVVDRNFYEQWPALPGLARRLGWRPAGQEGPYLFWRVSSPAPGPASRPQSPT